MADNFINKIICGDCVNIIHKIDNETIDLIITSPPYFGLRKYGEEIIGRELSPIDYINNLFSIYSTMKRVLKNTGSLYIVIGDVYFGTKGFSRNKNKFARLTDYNYINHKICKQNGKYLQYKQLLMLPARLVIQLQNDGWILRNQLIWEKPNPMPSFSADRRLPVYETILHLVKTRKYYFNYPKAKELRNYRDVIKCGIEPFKEHKASFPEKLIEPLILTSSKIGNLVLDPMCGSGTVCKMAKVNNRKYIGIDISEEYCKIAEKRINNVI